MRPRHPRHRCPFDQGLFDDPPLLLDWAVLPLGSGSALAFDCDKFCGLRGSVHLRSKWTRSICVSTKNKDVLLSHLCPDGYQRTLTLRVHPQPAIIFRLLNQPCLYRILSDVFAFLLQTLIRPQHMIEGFLFPDRTGSVKKPVDAMRRGSFPALQNIHKRKWPTILVPQRQEEKMDMVGYDYDCIEMYSCGAGALARERLDATFPQAVFKNQIASRLRQCQTSSRTEGDEHRRVGLLQVWKPPAIAVFSQRRSFGGHGTRGAGAPARHLRFQSELLPRFVSVTNEHARQICFQSGISSRRALSRARAPAPHACGSPSAPLRVNSGRCRHK